MLIYIFIYPCIEGKSKCQTGGKSKRTIQGTHKTTKQNTSVDCKITSSTTGDKPFDKSPTKTRHPRKIDLRARYWAFLFDNLRRAVDEIYVTCESDQSVVECKVRFTLRLCNPFEVSVSNFCYTLLDHLSQYIVMYY